MSVCRKAGFRIETYQDALVQAWHSCYDPTVRLLMDPVLTLAGVVVLPGQCHVPARVFMQATYKLPPSP